MKVIHATTPTWILFHGLQVDSLIEVGGWVSNKILETAQRPYSPFLD